MIDERKRALGGLNQVVEGSLVAHVWRSGDPRYDGVDMVVQYRQPDEEVGEDDHGIDNERFVRDVDLHYAGTLSPDEAAQKLAGMRVAANVADTMRGE